MQFVQGVAKQAQKVGVGVQHPPLGGELGHGFGAVQRLHGADELGVALFGFGHIQQHAIDPAHHAVVVGGAAPVFGHPTALAVACGDAVFHVVGLVVVQRGLYQGGDALAVVGVDDLAEMLLALHKRVGTPAGQGQHGLADELHGPQAFDAAAKGHTRNVAHQRAQLFFAAAQRQLHAAAGADVGQKAHEQHLSWHGYAPHGQADGHQGAVFVPGFYLAALSDDARAPRAQMGGQVAIVCAAVRLGHEHVNVAPYHLLGPPAQQALGGHVVRLHNALAVDGDDAVHGRVANGAQARFVALALPEQLAIAQAGIHGNGR